MMFMPELQPNGGFEWTQAAGGLALRCRPLLPYAPHLFTTRDLILRDDRDEWALVADAVGVDVSSLRLIRQVHGVGVAVVREGDRASWTRPEADVIVSNHPHAAIVVRVADCAPVLFADARLGAVGAAHAGWRGAMQGAAPAAVLALREQFGSKPQDLIVAIGPCLGACCGEVGPEVVEGFRNAGHSQADVNRWFRPGANDRSLLDLAAANVDQLVAAGVPRAQIHNSGLCTKSHARLFHSYRADRQGAGRMAAAIRRKEDGGRKREEDS